MDGHEHSGCTLWRTREIARNVHGDSGEIAQTLVSSFTAIDEIGHAKDGDGYRRFAWTEQDARLRVWFAAEALRRGLEVKVDAAGNQWAWWELPRRGEKAITTGSHLDSVPDGGAFDGPLGVIGAFAAIDELRRTGFRPSCAVGVVNCSDEEGARFARACVGSRVAMGQIAPEEALDMRDCADVTLREALEGFGPLLEEALEALDLDETTRAKVREGSRAPLPGDYGPEHGFSQAGRTHVELHVEQGVELGEREEPVALASLLWPHGRWRVEFSGQANHAGTTPLSARHDPLVSFTRFFEETQLAARKMDIRATVGQVQVIPGGVNVIASKVVVSLDVRADTEVKIDRFIDRLDQQRQAGRFSVWEENAGCTMDRESYSEPVVFDEALSRRLVEALRHPDGRSIPVIGSGAGHDSGIFQKGGIPTAMLFVRNATGVSHSPEEHVTLEDCVAGTLALSRCLRELVTSSSHGDFVLRGDVPA